MFSDLSTTRELKDAIKQNLHNRGDLKNMKAKIMSNIFSNLQGGDVQKKNFSNNKESDLSCIIYDLISEFLSFHNLRSTDSVLRMETNRGVASLSRHMLCQSLKIRPTVSVHSLRLPKQDFAVHHQNADETQPLVESPVPLLYYIVDWLQRKPSISTIQPSTEATSGKESFHVDAATISPLCNAGSSSSDQNPNEILSHDRPHKQVHFKTVCEDLQNDSCSEDDFI